MPQPSTNASDQYGRALEYSIVAEIIRQLPASQIQLTARTEKKQQIDFLKYASLPIKMQQSYQRFAICVFNWLKRDFSISDDLLQIDRLPDSSSRRGDVTDIRISTSFLQINLSVKHNHKALKHQRPSATAQHCGFIKGSKEDVDFRIEYKNIMQAFLVRAQGCSKFSDLDRVITLNDLYVPVCNLVTNFINQNCLHQVNASHLFSFLVGNNDFYKLIFKEKEQALLIEEFSRLPLPSNVNAQHNQNYIYLDFSNNWKVSMRLHTASSRIHSSPSLKFDTQPIEIVVPTEIFKIEN